MSNIIGISANFHDSACCLLQGGQLKGAISEERFSRIKNDSRLPIRSFHHLLAENHLSITDIDCVAYYENPYKKLSRQLSSNYKISQDKNLNWLDCHKPFLDIREILGFEGDIKFYDHHLSHAAGSYFFSGFSDAAILTSDGVGEWATTTFGRAAENAIDLFGEIHYPNSVGLLYSTITNFLGFKALSGEYKVMGLAPYGKPVYLKQLRELYEIGDAFNFTLKSQFFDFNQVNRMYTDALTECIGFNPRRPESELQQHHKDLARSLQCALEEILIDQINALSTAADSKNLCMSGGVALNCVANHAIRKLKLFDDIYIAPASGDAGSSLGAAALAHVELTGTRHSNQKQQHVYLGPQYDNQEILQLLNALELNFSNYLSNEKIMLGAIVDRLLEGKVIGWFQGRMEFGPRALGSRSIIADPRRPDMRDKLNALVKKRESFRPFAPAILEDKAAEHIELTVPSRFMLETCQVTSDIALPAITHVDGSCRPQTASKHINPKFYALIAEFYSRTGCPMLVNTSFNVRGEPIVCSPLDALRCFGNSGIDSLAIGDFLIDRDQLPDLFETMAQRESTRQKPGDFFRRRQSEAVYTFL